MKKPVDLLVVDDDRAHRTMLKTLLSGWGYRVTEADDGDVAVSLVEERTFDMILMDVRMIRMSGLEALPRLRRIDPLVPVVIMTAYSSVETAVEALKAGAHDYLTKPLDFDKLKVTIERTVDHARLQSENRRLRARLAEHLDRGEIIGGSPAMARVLERIAQVAPTEATVLITGESGTGKELVAAALHYNSPRRDGPFVKINCAALAETLLDSELFGHERGAFTGAERRKDGKFLLADGGTLFLDEVSEMAMPMQAKLLRVLQEKEFSRVGGEAVIRVDVRLIAATNRRLEDAVAAGAFREDLYYRLNVVAIEMPSLAERREDIPLLVDAFLRRFSEKNRKDLKGVTPEAMGRLVRHSWPGNVRELMNVVESAVVLTRDEVVDVSDLPPVFQAGGDGKGDALPEAAGVGEATLEEVEKAVIMRTLAATGGNKSEAARRLGISRKTLHNKLKQYGEA
jgi:two-component system response regulator HydG